MRPLIFRSLCIGRILFIGKVRTKRLHHKIKEFVMIHALDALFDISLALASGALTLAAFSILIRLAAVVRRRVTAVLQRQHDSMRMQ
jgi:hypothetical protein